jgi:hypothetical protein
VSATAARDRRYDRLQGSPYDPAATGRTGKHERPPLEGPEKLLLAIRDPDWSLQVLQAAALLVHALDVSCRQRIIDQRSQHAA